MVCSAIRPRARPAAPTCHRRRPHHRPGTTTFAAGTIATSSAPTWPPPPPTVYETAGVGPEDIRVVELHDCFTTNELLTYEALGLTPEGSAEKFIRDGDNTYGGGRDNPSGGLLSKGHPLGATGLAQCAELVWQLRGQAGARQVEGVKLALQHNLGLGGARVVTLYKQPPESLSGLPHPGEETLKPRPSASESVRTSGRVTTHRWWIRCQLESMRGRSRNSVIAFS